MSRDSFASPVWRAGARKVWLGGRIQDGVHALHYNERILDLTGELWASVTTAASLGIAPRRCVLELRI
jgi:hypothetical protein